MADTDIYFTQTIVGTPFSTALGCRVGAAGARALGLEVPLDGRAAQLSQAWRDDWFLRGAGGGLAGQPFKRPDAFHRWAERHALAIAAFGLCSLGLAGAVAVGVWLWP